MGWRFQRKHLNERLSLNERLRGSVWEGTWGGLGKGDGRLGKRKGLCQLSGGLGQRVGLGLSRREGKYLQCWVVVPGPGCRG